ncbi:hypothetical protein EA187_16960 [Lujinxingia sediminis]|uniref:Tetratricopeptide repeat protein n=1 Tax=Lujinxingia sediminis TaxID=2480984 RepID=A0ABY0CP91_9DELT|nr:hypothetical protein [Lujinxingia sediminis]RVU42276.1 hypothetical protein EA187_16960 [Lujinxingia sediminis]
MAWLRGLIHITVLSMLVVGVGCAHGRSLKHGDEHFERGNYEAALRSYRDAQIARPGSQEALQRARRAERLLVDDALVALDKAVDGQQRVEVALGRADEVLEIVRSDDLRERLTTRFGSAVLTLADRFRGEGRIATALSVLDQAQSVVESHPSAFGDGFQEFSHRVSELERVWSEELVGRAHAAMEGGRPASAALYGAMAQSLDATVLSVGVADRFAREVRQRHGWSIVAEYVNPSRVKGIEAAVRARAPFAAIGFGVDVREFQYEADLNLDGSEPRLERWEEAEQRSEEYQSGTREVSNPAYVDQRDELLRAEESVVRLERDIAKSEHALHEHRREYREDERKGLPTSLSSTRIEREEERLSELREDMIDARYRVEREYLELQRIPPTLLEPVYSMHSYEVIAQWAELSATYDVVVDVPGVAFEHTGSVEVAERDVSFRHRAQRELDLGARRDPLPRESVLGDRFEASLAEEVGAEVLSGFDGYRRQWASRQGSAVERVEALATYILLSPQRVDASLSSELARLSGIPAPEVVLTRLVASPGPRVSMRE